MHQHRVASSMLSLLLLRIRALYEIPSSPFWLAGPHRFKILEFRHMRDVLYELLLVLTRSIDGWS